MEAADLHHSFANCLGDQTDIKCGDERTVADCGGRYPSSPEDQDLSHLEQWRGRLPSCKAVLTGIAAVALQLNKRQLTPDRHPKPDRAAIITIHRAERRLCGNDPAASMCDTTKTFAHNQPLRFPAIIRTPGTFPRSPSKFSSQEFSTLLSASRSHRPAVRRRPARGNSGSVS